MLLFCFLGQYANLTRAEDEPHIEFINYRNPAQKCPGIIMKLKADLVPDLDPNEKIISDFSEISKWDPPAESATCTLDEEYWVCHHLTPLSNAITFEVLLRSSINKSRVFAVKPRAIYYYTGLYFTWIN